MKKVMLLLVVLTLACFVHGSAFTANSKPTVGTITPVSGTSNPYQPLNLTTTYADADGWQDIQYVNLLINSSTSGSRCFYGYYDRATNLLYLRNDTNTAWLGGFTPGSFNIIENSYAKLDCSKTIVNGSGTTLAITWNAAFKTTFTGTKYAYLYVKDNANAYAGWTKKASRKISANIKPQAGIVTPSAGANFVNTFVNASATYTDSNSVEDIHYAYILFNTSTKLTNCLYAYYDRSTDKLYLRDDANKAWLGGFAPGSANVIENSYARLDCSTTTISQQANTLTVNWALSFKYTFVGAKNIYLYVTDNAGSYSGWIKRGTRMINALFYWAVVDECDKPLPTEGYYYNYTGGDRGLMNSESEIAYQWDGNSSYSATALVTPGGFGWTWAGMWYSLIKVSNDNIPLDFKAIFGPYVKNEYQGEVTDIEFTVNKFKSPGGNPDVYFRVELKDEYDNIIGTKEFKNLRSLTYPRTFTWNLPESCKKKIKLIIWVLDKARKGDTISVDKIRLRTLVPDQNKMSSQEQAFLWTFSWLMTNYNPDTGMVQDRSNFHTGDSENVTATAKLAKIVYYAYKKGYVSQEDAIAVITKIADTLIYRVPRGPSGINTLWPHFTRNGGTMAVAPHDGFAGTEWASGDTAYAALDIITALQLIGDPQAQIVQLENFLKQINWSDLLSGSNLIGHGYTYEGNKIVYTWGGFGMETVGVNWAYASSTGIRAEMAAPPSDNGSGFIDNALYPILFSGTDAWDNNWDTYRSNMADTQIGWYKVPGRNQYLVNTDLFGLSAAETPEADGGYQAYGVGGKNVALNDGNSEVVTLHYSGMISDIRPVQAVKMWEAMRDKSATISQNKILVSPLNNIESIRINKATGKCTANYLKGSWNMVLQAEGWALADANIRADLFSAIQNNAFLKKGYDILKTDTTADSVLRVPQDYPTISAAINAAVSGNTILVATGTYNESINLNKSGIVLQGTNRSSVIQGINGSPVIDCSDLSGAETKISGFTIIDGTYGIRCAGTVSSLRIEDNFLPSPGTGIYLLDAAAVVVKNNTINNSAPVMAEGHNNVQIIGNTFRNTIGPNPPGIYLYNSSTALVKDNYFSQRWGGAVNLYGGSNADVIGNKFVSCYGWSTPCGVTLVDSTATLKNNLFQNCQIYSGGSSVVLASGSTISLYNNVFYNNSGNTISVIYSYNSNFTAKNNILANNFASLDAVRFVGSGTQEFSYNNLWQNNASSTTGVIAGAGNLSIDPAFVSSNDFHLNPASACINAGDPDSQYNDKDGSRNDMGIYGGPDFMQL